MIPIFRFFTGFIVNYFKKKDKHMIKMDKYTCNLHPNQILGTTRMPRNKTCGYPIHYKQASWNQSGSFKFYLSETMTHLSRKHER